MQNSIRRTNPSSRNGFATILVIVSLLALSLAVFSFAEQSFLEHASTRASMRQTQARLTALSGVERIRGQLTSEEKLQRDAAINPLEMALNNREQNVAAFQEFDSLTYRSIPNIPLKVRNDFTPGLASESAKLNIHSLDLTKKGESISRARLSALPQMTPQLADALLDWIDEDDMPRTFGAEAAWYSQNHPKHRPPNQPVHNWNELLFVKGFSEQLLFGEDINLNGWLDWNENDGDQRLPIDNADSVLDQGLAKFISLDAYEWARDTNGQPKINLNDDNLPSLFDKISKRFGEDTAIFIVAFRMDGPVRNDESFDKKSTEKSIRNSIEERLDYQLTPLNGPQASSRDSRATVQRGGLSLNKRPIHRILSVIDLIDVSVLTLINNEEKLLKSPWKLDASDNHQMIMDMESAFTTTSSDRLVGRIDITQALPEVLGTIPGFSSNAALALVERRQQLETSGIGSIRSIYWLVENQIVDFDLLRSVAPFITIEGAIYTGYSVGRDSVSNSAAIGKFTLSREGKIVRLLEYREIGMTPWIRNDVRNDRARSK